MERLATYAVTVGVICMIAASAHAGPRGGFFAPGVAPQSPEVMIYFSHSMGTGLSSRPTFGLRVQQVRQGSNSGDPESGDVMHRRELLNWQMEARPGFRLADVRVQLGHRLTYDLTTRSFGSPHAASALPIATPSLRARLSGRNAPALASGQAVQTNFSDETVSRATLRPSQVSTTAASNNVRELAVAAMTALAPSRLTAARHPTKTNLLSQPRLARP